MPLLLCQLFIPADQLPAVSRKRSEGRFSSQEDSSGCPLPADRKHRVFLLITLTSRCSSNLTECQLGPATLCEQPGAATGSSEGSSYFLLSTSHAPRQKDLRRAELLFSSGLKSRGQNRSWHSTRCSQKQTSCFHWERLVC